MAAVFFAAAAFADLAAGFAAVFFTAVFFAAVSALAAVFAVVFFAADLFAGFSSAASASAAFLRTKPRLSSGRKFSHAGLMQNGFLKPLPAFLNIVCPQTGQSSLVGTSHVMKSHFFSSSRLVPNSQQ